MAGQEMFERPQSRRATRNSTTGFVVREPNERPPTRNRRSSVPSNFSNSPSPRYSDSEPITPRPPPSQRPQSRFRSNQRTQSQDHGVNQMEGDVQFGSPGSSRPSTASSLNRYTPLPSIGTQLDLYESPRNDAQKDLAVKSMQLSGSTHSRNQKVIKGRESKSESRSETSREKERRSSRDKRQTKTDDRKQSVNMKDKVVTKESQSGDISTAIKKSDAIVSFDPLKRKIKLPPEPSEKNARLTLAVKLPAGQRVQRSFAPSNTLQNVMEFAESMAKLDFHGCHLACNVPIKFFSKLNMTLQESGIQDRTIFHIHVPN